jgi:hypothetical protein
MPDFFDLIGVDLDPVWCEECSQMVQLKIRHDETLSRIRGVDTRRPFGCPKRVWEKSIENDNAIAQLYRDALTELNHDFPEYPDFDEDVPDEDSTPLGPGDPEYCPLDQQFRHGS